MIKTTSSTILFWCFVYLSVSEGVGLMCYNCASTKPFSKCESDIRELKKGIKSKFAVNCSDYANLTQPYCSIETHRQNGGIHTILRDCSDGSSFTFDLRLPQFEKMKFLNTVSNVTICTFYQTTVCVSLCQEDMCNGPQDFNGSLSTRNMLISLTLLTVACFSSLFL